jgi:hypothetical protein
MTTRSDANQKVDVWTLNILIEVSEADFSKISKLAPILINFFVFCFEDYQKSTPNIVFSTMFNIEVRNE